MVGTEKDVRSYLEEQQEIFFRLNDDIWDFAEVRFEEHRSAALQMELLQENGFTVERGLSRIDTAFRASWGSGGPVIAVLGEFDALPQLSQKADSLVPEPRREGGAGHGCGHNTLGAASLAAAMAVKEMLTRRGLPGTIRYYGCPAEEGGGGKTFMVRDGYFSDVDAALTWHPGSMTSVLNSGFLANVKVLFDFEGTASHAAAAPEMGRSALDAAELMNVGVNFLREHMSDDARIHYAITDAGGDAPNVVQARAQLLYTVRAPESREMLALFERVKDVARGAALMTGTESSFRVVAGYSNYLANPVLSRLMSGHASAAMERLTYTDEEYAYARAYQETFPAQSGGMERLVEIPEEQAGKPLIDTLLPPLRKLPGSSDVGDVSWVVPTAQFMGGCYALGTPGHSWQQVAQGKSAIVHKGLLSAAEIVASTALTLFEKPEIVKEIQNAHFKTRRGRDYICPIPDDLEPNSY